MNESVIEYEAAAPVARITLNRPDKLNALSYALIDALSDALRRAAGTTR